MPPQMMADIDINETSGVDHPAHLEEGWVVVKSADPASIHAALAALTKETPVSDDTVLDDDVLKAVPAPVRELLEKQAAAVAEAQRSADEANARLAAEINKSRDAAKVTMLKSLSALSFDDVDAVAKSLRELDDINPDLARIIEGALTKANGQAESAELFKELGSGNRPATGSAEERLTNLAKARAESTGVSFAKAMDEVAHAEPALYADYVAERRG